MPNPFDLTGRVAVVTGGYGVLGGSMARRLGNAGVRVAVLGRQEAHASAVAQSIRDTGGEAMTVIADVTDRAALAQARQAVLDTWGRIDILVNEIGRAHV